MKRFTLATVAMLAGSFAFGCTIPEPRQASSAGESNSPRVAAPGVALEGVRAGPAEPPPSAPANDIAGGRELALAAAAGEIAPDADSYTTQETDNAERVLAGMQDEFLVCYKTLGNTTSANEVALTLDVLLGPDGKVSRARATGNLRDGVKECIISHVRSAVFDPPHQGGTLRIRTSFVFRLNESIGAELNATSPAHSGNVTHVQVAHEKLDPRADVSR